MLKCKHQCHCQCSSEIGKCIINDAGRQAAHNKQQKYTFLKVNIKFQCKKILSKKLTNSMTIYL